MIKYMYNGGEFAFFGPQPGRFKEHLKNSIQKEKSLQNEATLYILED